MKLLFIASHADDIELSCAGTIAKMKANGHEVHCYTFSSCDDAQLIREYAASMNLLDIESHLDYMPVRLFNNNRQYILDALIKEAALTSPDFIFTHSAYDRHQDHRVVGEESLRAFRNNTVLTYTSVINRLEGQENYFVRLTSEHMLKKANALKCYKSQERRAYMQPDVVYATAHIAGLKAGCEFAEGFELVKMIS